MGAFTFATATPASATAAYGHCSVTYGGLDGILDFSLHWHWRDSTHRQTWITGFNYKIHGQIRNQNNLVLAMKRVGSSEWLWQKGLNEIPYTNEWKWVDIDPNMLFPASYQVYGYGSATFDMFGFDPGCTDVTGYI